MKSGTFRLVVVITMLMFVLAACTPAAAPTDAGTAGDGAGTTVTESAPATDGMPTAESYPATEAAGGAAAGTCVGVDTQQLMTSGQTLYADRCASCHGAQGEGQGDFPALAANASLSAGGAAELVTSYLAVEAHPKDVTPDDLAAILTYVRGSFGNTAAAVCPADIQIPAAP